MQTDLSPQQRLELLSQHSLRPWTSLHEMRRCAMCERVFSGHEVRVQPHAAGGARLQCPNRHCRSLPRFWVHPADPMMSADAWTDWDRMIAQSFAEDEVLATE